MGTGMEHKICLDSEVAVLAEGDGVVTKVDATCVTVRYDSGETKDYAALHGGEWNPGGLYAKRDELQRQVDVMEAADAALRETGSQVAADIAAELKQIEFDIADAEERINKGIYGGEKWDFWYAASGRAIEDSVLLNGNPYKGTTGLYVRREELQAQLDEIRADAEGGAPIDVPVTASGGTEAMSAELGAMQSEANRGVSVPIYTRSIGGNGRGTAKMARYGEGGRATEASVFGEDGPEWAIPEEHTPRTAELLNATRKAAGFDWDELMARDGRVSGGVTVNTTYAPTINAADSSGVADVLEKDKRRTAQIVKEAVREALREQRFRDSVEVYA